MITIEKPESTSKPKRTVFDGRLYLKVKLKSLAAEAKIIREEERKHPKFKQGLQHHRTTVVRAESRATQLAYGFIRGAAYKEVEPNRRPLCAYHASILWPKVEAMVKKYGKVHVTTTPIPWQGREQLDKEVMERFQQWKTEAME